MKSVIIHRSQRTDRIPAIARILATYPDTKILDAKVPAWEANQHNRAVRGCTLSHLSAVKAFLAPNEPLLLFEDDAVPLPDADLMLDKIPADAGIVIYGGDVTSYGDPDPNGFRQVLPKFFGTQAVLYTPALLRTPFLLDALEIAATECLGTHPNLPGLCLESVLLRGLMRTGLKMYRPHRMCFAVVPSAGDSGIDSGTRSLALEAVDRDSLFPWDSWEEVFKPWVGAKAHLLNVPGNAGDALIRAATLRLFRHYNITEAPLEDAEVVMWPGGGNVGGQYSFTVPEKKFLAAAVPKVILPQTLVSVTPCVEAADEVWVRDHTSNKIFPKALFAPDLSLAYRPGILAERQHDTGTLFRLDQEAFGTPTDNVADPAAGCPSHYDYLKRAGSYRAIRTNRLHFAIAGLIMGCEVTLYPNSYHKNLSVYEASLGALGCKWAETKPLTP